VTALKAVAGDADAPHERPVHRSSHRLVTSTARAAQEEVSMPQGPHDVPAEAEPPAMRLLAGGVPLSLLVDLATDGGPDSAAILESEGGPEDHWWEPPTH
jgi:hypothetical protein